MTDTHDCPFTAGELLALGAIAETRSHADRAPAGARALAEKCFTHAGQHDAPKGVDDGAPMPEA